MGPGHSGSIPCGNVLLHRSAVSCVLFPMGSAFPANVGGNKKQDPDNRSQGHHDAASIDELPHDASSPYSKSIK